MHRHRHQHRRPATPQAQAHLDGRVERHNLAMRMGMRRFTRLTNAVSKKAENHAVAIHFVHYNFVRINKALRVTPAMGASVTDRPWSIEDILNLPE